MLVINLLVLLCVALTAGSDYYELLGITKDADYKEIRKAFKKLVVTLHPDKNQDPDAHEKFLKVTRAYEVLKDPQQQKQYDLHGETGPSSWSQLQYHSYTYYKDHFGIYDDDPTITQGRIKFQDPQISPEHKCKISKSPRDKGYKNLADIFMYPGLVLIGIVIPVLYLHEQQEQQDNQ